MCPVADVMALADRHAAARESAATVAMVQRAPYRRGNGPRPRADFRHTAVGVMPHHHPGRVARKALGRSRGNVCAAVEDGLSRRFGIGQHRSIDVDDDLVALARGSGIEGLMKRGLSEEH